MAFWLRFLSCAFLLVMPLTSIAQHAVPRPPAEWVRDLGDPSYRVRERADRELRALGRGAIPALQEGIAGESPEVRQRCILLMRLAGKSDVQLRLEAFIREESSSQEPFAGWLKFKELAGSSPDTRTHFAQLYADQPELLAELDKLQENSKAIEQMLRDRLQRAVRGNTQEDLSKHKASDFLACVWIALQLPLIPQEQFHLFHELCYQQQQRGPGLVDPLLGKLLTTLFKRQPLSLNDGTLDMVVRMASHLGLTELIEDKLKGSIKAAIEQETKDALVRNPGRLNQLAHLARDLKQFDLLEGHLRPAARRVADAFAAMPFDPNRFHEVYWLVQTLQLNETRDFVLKPAALRHALANADLPGSESVFFQAYNCLIQFGMDDATKKLLQPAARQVLARFGDGADQLNQFGQAIQISRSLALEECLERDLKPALKKIAATVTTQPNQAHNLQQLVNVAQQLGDKEVLEGMVAPHVRKQLQDWDAKPRQLTEFHQLFQLTRRLDKVREFDPLLRPLAKKVIEAYQKDWRKNPGYLYAALDLVAQADLINQGLDLALDVALDKAASQPWYTFQGLQFIDKHGKKEHFLRLEPLLDNKQVVTSYGINARIFNLQTRDVALQLLLRAHGETLTDYGFQAAMLPQAVLDDKDREAAFRRYREKFGKKTP
jgi:hypothetical protein